MGRGRAGSAQPLACQTLGVSRSRIATGLGVAIVLLALVGTYAFSSDPALGLLLLLVSEVGVAGVAGYWLWRDLAASRVRRPGVMSVGAALGVGFSCVVTLVGLTTLSPVSSDLYGLEGGSFSAWQWTYWAIYLVVLAPLGEEVLFRGLLFSALLRWCRPLTAAVLVTAAFAALHPGEVPHVVVVGAVLMACALRWGVVESTIVHAVVNGGGFGFAWLAHVWSLIVPTWSGWVLLAGGMLSTAALLGPPSRRRPPEASNASQHRP